MILLVQTLSAAADLPMTIVIELITRQRFVNMVLCFRDDIATIKADFILCFCSRTAGAMGLYFSVAVTAVNKAHVCMAFCIDIAPHICGHLVICVIAVGGTASIAFCLFHAGAAGERC